MIFSGILFFQKQKTLIRIHYEKTKVIIGFLLFYAVMAIPTLLNYSDSGIQKMGYFAALIIMPVFILTSSYNLNEERFKKHVIVFCVAATVASLYLLITAIFRGYLLVESFNYWYFSYSLFAEPLRFQPIYLSLILSISFFLSLFYLIKFNELSRKLKVWVLCGLAVQLMVIFFLSARTSIVITVLMIFYYLLVSIKLKRNKLLSISAVFLVMVTLVFSNKILYQRLVEVIDYKSVKYGGVLLRLEKWDYSLETINRSILFGHGLGTAHKELMKTYKEHDFKLGLEHGYNAHNLYLQILLYSGIIGLICFLGLIYFLLGFNIDSKFNILMVVFLVLFLFNGITESLLERQYGLFTFSFFGSFLYLFIFSCSTNQNKGLYK